MISLAVCHVPHLVVDLAVNEATILETEPGVAVLRIMIMRMMRVMIMRMRMMMMMMVMMARMMRVMRMMRSMIMKIMRVVRMRGLLLVSSAVVVPANQLK